MNKKTITLICIFILLATLQLACSISDLLGGNDQDRPVSPPQESGEFQPQAPVEEDQTITVEVNLQPPADQSSCSKSFAGSSNIPEGSQYQAGDSIEVTFTLTNTGTCTWSSAYQLVVVGGDFSPVSTELPLVSEVAPGESVMFGVEYTAPAQDGLYMSVWKMEDDQGGVFGMDSPSDAPLRIKIRVVPSGNPQPTPNPTQAPQQDQQTMLEGECFDFNTGVVVDCNDSSADFRYSYSMIGAKLFKANFNEFAEGQDQEPDLNACENANYAPIPQTVVENKYKCFKIDTIASLTYGWMRITQYNENGLTFDFEIIDTGAPSVTAIPNTTLFVESQGQQITLLEGECYDVWNGQVNSNCSGIFAGFLFEEVTKKSIQVSQISPNEMEFSVAMSSEPTKSDCMNASYSASPIWPIQSTSYYCYQFVPGTNAYFGWLRPTSFNLGGMTFDYLTWETVP